MGTGDGDGFDVGLRREIGLSEASGRGVGLGLRLAVGLGNRMGLRVGAGFRDGDGVGPPATMPSSACTGNCAWPRMSAVVDGSVACTTSRTVSPRMLVTATVSGRLYGPEPVSRK